MPVLVQRLYAFFGVFPPVNFRIRRMVSLEAINSPKILLCKFGDFFDLGQSAAKATMILAGKQQDEDEEMKKKSKAHSLSIITMCY